ncbi:SGNH hydrolase-type esterase domain-containing protein [Aspergillus leporis]|uniref:SGNH hydrolase-type esterase domain-containing protein n=1 Tax=Aspergillus leporis TaxID=41062 RepID=A0A5N5XHN3_9EURO|nr:SGNH hydrolase-type esterase domain-containing protein [Aspergillus leporis]
MSTDSQEEALYKPYDQFILFGDSITQMSNDPHLGFALQGALQDAYIRRFDVINRGFGGYTSGHAINVFAKFFPTPEKATVRFMTIFFGANDACLPGNPQHVPVNVYKENLIRIIQHPATVAQSPHILIVTPPPINEYQLQEFDESKGNAHPTRTAKHTKQYAEAVREVGSSLGVPVVDVWSAFMAAVGWKEGEPLPGSRDLPNSDQFQRLFTDGLHLTADGYRIVYDELMAAIRANWLNEQPEQLPMVFPGWMEAPR